VVGVSEREAEANVEEALADMWAVEDALEQLVKVYREAAHQYLDEHSDDGGWGRVEGAIRAGEGAATNHLQASSY
jgi:hypothetical protein